MVGVSGLSSVNMLSSLSAVSELHFSFDFTDVLQSCGLGQFQRSSLAAVD